MILLAIYIVLHNSITPEHYRFCPIKKENSYVQNWNIM